MPRENVKREKNPSQIANEILKIIKREFKKSNLKVLDTDEEGGENFEISNEGKEIFIAFSIKDNLFYIIDIQIKNKEEGLGVSLIKKIEKELESNSFKKIIAEPIADSPQAWSFWTGKANCGFTKTGPNTAEKILK
jgi:hypothetical protein